MGTSLPEVIGWLRRIGFAFVKSVPRSRPSPGLSDCESLFQPEEPGNWLERAIVELGMIRSGSREGGFFIVIGRKSADGARA